jgi:hypothetical protein
MRSYRSGIATFTLLLVAASTLPQALSQQQVPPQKTNFPEVKPQSQSEQNAAAQAGAAADEGQEDDGFAERRDAWFYGQRAFPAKTIPVGAHAAAFRQMMALKSAPVHTLLASPAAALFRGAHPQDTFSNLSWTFDGPSSLSSGTGRTPYSGRATALAISPSNPSILYLGTAGGGVWKSVDAGAAWAPLTDSQPSLAVGAIALDPVNPNIVYVGTGEGNLSGDSYYGEGLLKSTDGGTTWTQISAPFVSNGRAAQFTQIAIQPDNSSVLLAATESGIFRSSDAGATWTAQRQGYASAVLFDPANPSTAYAGFNGYFSSIVYGAQSAAIFKSIDAGVTWTPLTGGTSNPLPAAALVYRTALALDSAGNLLAGIAPSSAGAGTPYKSTDGGQTWATLTSPNDGLDWYRDWIVAVPGSPNVLFAGGVSLYQSLDGGTTWSRSTQSYNTLLWADQHGAVFSPDGSKMYLFDDGGIFVTTTAPSATDPKFASLNNGIGTMTYYPGFSISGPGAQNTIVGSQDHGTQLGNGSQAWVYAGGPICGDGGPMTADATGDYVYAHCQGSPLSRWMSSSTGGSVLGLPYPYGWVSAQSGINVADRTAWVPPIATDPSSVATLYTGTYRIYQSTNRASTWTPISSDLTAGSATLNTIAIAPSNANVIYTGAGDGSVFVSTNALSGTSSTWTRLNGLPSRAITKLVVTPASSQEVYVTLSGFSTGHVFHSTNGGTTWADISGNLPNTPVNSIAVDPSLVKTLYAATDTGVFVSSNGGTSWEVLGANLPNVVVADLQIVPSSRILRIITHGRGAWDLTLPLTAFVASTNVLAFGSQGLNTPSAVQTITLSNNVQTAVSVSSIAASSNYSQTNNCGTSLASGSTCTVTVTFTPTAVGTANGTLAIASSLGNISVLLTGTGIGVPVAKLSAGSINFLNQALGFPSTAQTLQLQNTGAATLTGIAASLSGANSTDFAQTTTCGATLMAGASCSIAVTFTPAAVGNRTATLSIADNVAGSPQTASLVGNGAAPFSLSATSTSATVKQGATASYTLNFAATSGTTAASAVALSCAGLPTLSTCSFSPASIAAGTSAQTVTLTISTTAPTAELVDWHIGKPTAAVLSCGLFALCLLPRRRRSSWLAILILTTVTLGLSSCSSQKSASTAMPGTTLGAASVVVTGQSTNYSTTQSLTLNVTP